MRLARLATSAAFVLCATALPAAAQHFAPSPPEAAPYFRDRGSYHMAITTKSSDAQRYFDQGLRLMMGFNLEEAERSFAHAEQLDSTCAMCAWGTAFSLGPHINVPAMPDRTIKAYAAAMRAVRLESGATPRERALIDAMKLRYADPAPTDPAAQGKLDQAYADAMHEVVQRYPDDPDVNWLWADAAMDLHPWDLYEPNGTAKPWTGEIVAALERAIAKAPGHVGANHLYIHAVEGSNDAARALPSAKRLENASPGEAHLVHMPSHIYHRIGLYEQSMEANRRAVIADGKYLEAVHPQGFYLMYSAHNHQFLMWSCWMSGRQEEAMREARATVDAIPLDMLRQMPGFDMTIGYPVWTMVRFGRWADVLNEPEPPSDFAYARGGWRAARAIALAELGRLDEAAAERDSANAMSAVLPDAATEGWNPAKTLLGIGSDMATGLILAKQGKTDDAVAALTKAVAAEDGLRYDEPSDWYVPARHALGEVLLEANRAADAQKVYEADLARNPNNPWALTGLAKSLRVQKRGKDATLAESKAARALKDADVKLAGSWM